MDTSMTTSTKCVKRKLLDMSMADQPSNTKNRLTDESFLVEHQLFYDQTPGKNHNFPLDVVLKVFQKCPFCNKKGLNQCSHLMEASYTSSRILLSNYLSNNAGGHYKCDLPSYLMQRSFPIPGILSKSFVAVDVPRDNNCGFHALSTTLTLSTFYSKFLRRAIYLFAKFNPDVLSKISKHDKFQEEKFMKKLFQDGTWLDVWGLMIAAEYLSRKIIIYQKTAYRMP